MRPKMVKRGQKLALELLLMLVLILILCTACGQEPSRPTCPIKIGVITSQTGRHAEGGLESLRGYAMALEEINTSGGIMGCPVELIVKDDRSLPYQAQLAVKELVNEDQVSIISGAYSSAATMPAAGVANAYQVPFLAPTASSDLITSQGYEWVFRLIAPASGYANTALDFVQTIREELEINRLAVIYDDSLYGESAAVAVAMGAIQRNLDIVAYEEYNPGTANYRALLERVKAASPDVIYFASYLNEAIQLLQHSEAVNLNPKVYVGHAGGFIMLEFLQAGKHAEYVIGTAQWAKDVKWEDEHGQTATMFAERFADRYGVEPGMRSAQTYTTLYVIKDAIERAGTSESLEWSDAQSVRLAIRDALRETDIEKTIFGPVNFNQEGENNHPVVLIQVIDGQFVTVYPEKYRAASPIVPIPDWSARQ